MSTHQYPFYPGTGDATEIGAGPGEGYTVNVPLTAHGGDGVYRAAFEQVLLPIAEAYAPELVLVSAGFDAAVRDPLAQMEVTADGFGWMAAKLGAVAAKSAKGRIALVLEGGYDLVSLESGLSRAITAVAGLDGGSASGGIDLRDARSRASPITGTWRGRGGGPARVWGKVVGDGAGRAKPKGLGGARSPVSLAYGARAAMVRRVSGGRSSAGRAPDCGSGCRGFETRRSPRLTRSPGPVASCNPVLRSVSPRGSRGAEAPGFPVASAGARVAQKMQTVAGMKPSRFSLAVLLSSAPSSPSSPRAGSSEQPARRPRATRPSAPPRRNTPRAARRRR